MKKTLTTKTAVPSGLLVFTRRVDDNGQRGWFYLLDLDAEAVGPFITRTDALQHAQEAR